MGETGDVLSRFHAVLVDEIRAQRPDYLTGPFTVAEIYQNLTPYGSHRDRIGVEMNGDYEDALLRLLAGEGGYLVLDSEPALRRLRDELEGFNPNTGLYREYAAVDVRLDADRLDEGTAPSPELPPDAPELPLRGPELPFGGPELPLGDPRPVGRQNERAIISTLDLAPAVVSPGGVAPAEVAMAGPARTDEARADVDVGVATPAELIPSGSGTDLPAESSSDSEPLTGCRWCRAELPARENLSFCPFCGTNVTVVPCPACGEELEPAWRFCVACGTEVDA